MTSAIDIPPYSDAVGRKAMKRYGLGKKPPLIRGADGVLEFADWVNEHAKVILRKDGNHRPMAFLCHAGRVPTILALDLPDTESKYVAIREVASAVSRTQAIGVILVNEAWWIPMDEFTGLRAG